MDWLTTKLGNFFLRKQVSIWLGVVIVLLCAFMMHPSLINFFVMFIVVGLLFLLRWVCHKEGGAEALTS